MSSWMKVLLLLEDRIVATILQRPGWHRFVGRIHRGVQEMRHGRDPNAPLPPGEATKDPNQPSNTLFWRHFVDEMKNQLKNTPTESPPPSPPTTKPAKKR